MPSQDCRRKGFRWFAAVIHHQAFNARRRYVRYSREILILNIPSEDGYEPADAIPCLWAEEEFNESEFWASIKGVLSYKEFKVIYNLFALGKTEHQTARQLGFSQQYVNRMKANALRNLRKELVAQ